MLNTFEQIDKWNALTRLAKEAAKSDEIVKKFGAFMIFANSIDFAVIQAFRLVSEIGLKGDIGQGKPAFSLYEDSFFYDKKKKTRDLLERIKETLPFRPVEEKDFERAKKVNSAGNKMIEAGFEFLNHRNQLVHHIGNPKKTLEEITLFSDKANESYQKFIDAHREFFENAEPYRLSEEQVKKFYHEGLVKS